MLQSSGKLLILLLAACALLSPIPAHAAEPAVNHAYPQMLPGQVTGSISGRVTTADTTSIIAEAFVAIVNASDTSIIYATGRSDVSGNYRFQAVNSTGGDNVYRIYAGKDGYRDGYSNVSQVRSSADTTANIVLQPFEPPTATPLPLTPYAGHVSGRITTGNGQGLQGTHVSVISAYDYVTIYGSAKTDSDGKYAIDTNQVSSDPVFRLHMEKDGYIDAYSVPFSITWSSPATVNVVYCDPTPVPTVNQVTPTPGTTAMPTQMATTITAIPSPVPRATITPAPAVITLTPTDRWIAATATDVPGATFPATTPRPSPGFATVIVVVSLALVIVAKRRRQ